MYIYQQFIEKFKEIKDLTRQQVAQQQVQQTTQVNGNVVDENHTASQSPPQPSQGARQILHHRSSSLSAVQVCCFKHALTKNPNNVEMILLK